jgi:hypothetical protein
VGAVVAVAVGALLLAAAAQARPGKAITAVAVTAKTGRRELEQAAAVRALRGKILLAALKGALGALA